MKIPKLALSLAVLAIVSTQAAAAPRQDCKLHYEAASVLTDVIVVRPASLLGTLAGGVLFVGLSPLTALASIPEPHDAFSKVGNYLIAAPYAYTFVRPVGQFGSACY